MDEDSFKAILKPRNEGESLKIAETVLKKRNHDIQGMADRAAKAAAFVKASRWKNRPDKVVSLERLVKRSIDRNIDKRRVRMVDRTRRPPEVIKGHSNKALLVVRNELLSPSRITSNSLRELGLEKRYTCVLLPNTAETLRRLQYVQYYLFWGLPSKDVIRTLVEKKAAICVDNEIVPLSSNTLVEDNLGDLGMVCLDDLVHELWSVGSSFTRITQLLRPFQLGNPKVVERLDAEPLLKGHLEDKINAKVQNML